MVYIFLIILINLLLISFILCIFFYLNICKKIENINFLLGKLENVGNKYLIMRRKRHFNGANNKSYLLFKQVFVFNIY